MDVGLSTNWEGYFITVLFISVISFSSGENSGEQTRCGHDSIHRQNVHRYLHSQLEQFDIVCPEVSTVVCNFVFHFTFLIYLH